MVIYPKIYHKEKVGIAMLALLACNDNKLLTLIKNGLLTMIKGDCHASFARSQWHNHTVRTNIHKVVDIFGMYCIIVLLGALPILSSLEQPE